MKSSLKIKKINNFHVRKAIKKMESSYSNSITLENMADYLGLNKSYFCSIFKKETGKTYSQTLNEIRVKESLKLLLDTNMTILEIALSVGYNNQSYYNMAFKKIMGTTPLKYRNKKMNHKENNKVIVSASLP